MFENIEWLFFDVGSTLIDERAAYEHRLRETADLAGVSYDEVYKEAVRFYKQNQKGDLEIAKRLNVELPEWHKEDEILYTGASECLSFLKGKYKIGIIANQSPGTKERLQKHGILQYIDLVIASAEEGVSKPDRRIFELALRRAGCDANKAVMIGDRIDNDIVPAKETGMKTIWIKQGFGGYWKITGKEEQPDRTVECLADLCDCL